MSRPRIQSSPSMAPLLAVAALSALSLALAAPPRGVPRSLEPSYSGNTFKCLDGQGSALPSSSINDNYCDCAGE